MKNTKSMHKLHIWFMAALTVAVLALALCVYNLNRVHSVVGAWFVEAPDAPFAYHAFSFGADGTMFQANPDAGNSVTSDGDGMGIWEVKDGKVTGKFVEATADRETHAFATRGEISFDLTVDGDKFTGTASANFYDVDGNLVRGPLATPISGQRVTLE